MAKVREVRGIPMGGALGGYPRIVRETRIRALEKGELLPEGAQAVPDNTPMHDWQEEAE